MNLFIFMVWTCTKCMHHVMGTRIKSVVLMVVFVTPLGSSKLEFVLRSLALRWLASSLVGFHFIRSSVSADTNMSGLTVPLLWPFDLQIQRFWFNDIRTAVFPVTYSTEDTLVIIKHRSYYPSFNQTAYYVFVLCYTDHPPACIPIYSPPPLFFPLIFFLGWGASFSGLINTLYIYMNFSVKWIFNNPFQDTLSWVA